MLNKLDTYREYTWDVKNRLTKVEQYSGVPVSGIPAGYNTNKLSITNYRYDVYGNRIGKEFLSCAANPNGVLVSRESYVPENGQQLIEYCYKNYDGYSFDNPSRMSHNLYTQAVDQILATDALDYDAVGTPTTQKTVWALTDYQNTVKMLFSKEGADIISQALIYDLFGKPEDLNNFDPMGQPQQGSSDALSGYVRARYAGREFDYETGLQYNRAHYYNPTSSRWMSEDPIGFAGGNYNLYRYCGNSPTNATDPSGNIAVASSIVIGMGLLGRQLLYGAANQYDAAAKVNRSSGYTQAMAERYNYHAGWGSFYEGSGRIAGTVAFIAAATPLFQPLQV